MIDTESLLAVSSDTQRRVEILAAELQKHSAQHGAFRDARDDEDDGGLFCECGWCHARDGLYRPWSKWNLHVAERLVVALDSGREEGPLCWWTGWNQAFGTYGRCSQVVGHQGDHDLDVRVESRRSAPNDADDADQSRPLRPVTNDGAAS